MPSLITALPLLLLSAATVEPTSIPASGRHDATVKLDEAGMVRITTDAPAGMSCAIVDHLRGPFASSGQPGASACALDLLLDEGVYKLRLRGPAKAKGTAKINVVPFEERHKAPLQLVPASEVQEELRSGQQSSFWVRVEQRGHLTFHAMGRTAGRLEVWRSGEWLEAINAVHHTVSVGEGQQLHDWWVEQVMEPGEYRFTVYGTDDLRWTKGKGHDLLHVAAGFVPAPDGRTLALTLPPTGFYAMQLTKGPIVAALSLTGPSEADTTLSLYPLGEGGESQLGSGHAQGSCTVAPKALIAECATSASDDGKHVLVVRGAPGTKVNLDWAPQSSSGMPPSGAYALGGRVVFTFEPPSTGTYRISTHDLPTEADSPPQGCILERGVSQYDRHNNWFTWTELTRDELRLSRARPFRRSFNHDGNLTRILFRVEDAAKYRIVTGGERGTRCELWRGAGPSRSRMTPSDLSAGPCDLQLRLEEGSYELTLHGGTEGIEKVRLTVDGATGGEDTATKSGCLFEAVDLQRRPQTSYRVTLTRSGAVSARGLFFEPVPVSLGTPYPVTLDPGARVKVPISGGQTVLARVSGGAPLECTRDGAATSASTFIDGKGGRCDFGALPSGPRELTLRNPGASPLSVLLHRPSQRTHPLPARNIQPVSLELQRAKLEVPTWLNFERGQQHALRFDVKEPGLYHVTTRGLLATTCDIRTPVIAGLGANSSGGRARNCLVAQYLRPGRYLLNVRAMGQSRGRAAVTVSRRPVKTIAALTPDAQLFFRADAGELVRQTLNIQRARRYRIDSTALGAQLQCRLDDADGWPMVAVPTSCSNAFYLRKAPYLWTQLPLTVESMRRTGLARVRGPALLKGDRAHRLAFNTPYTARLGADGKDELLFELPVELDVRILLTNAMQGRLFRLDGRSAKPVEIIPPQDTPAPPAVYQEEEQGERGYEDGEAYDPEYEPEPGEPPHQRTVAPPQPAGRLVHLMPGKYKLVAEHSRADVNIDYAVQVSTETLIPGAAIVTPVPASLPLRVPAAGTLRLHTEGQTDVRCRLFDAKGALLFENANRGEDWNCAIAEPISAGDYTVVLESETRVPGETTVAASVLEVKDGGPLVHGGSVTLGRAVQSFALPDVGDAVVHDLSVRSSFAIGCALEGPDGKLLHRRSDVTECAFLARLPEGPHRLRLWTLAADAKVNLSHWQRPISPIEGGRVPAGGAGAATVRAGGRYRTGGGVHCLAEGARGVLGPCGPEVSLEQGPYVFSLFGPTGEAQVPLAELVATAKGEVVLRDHLGPRPFIQRARAASAGLHLLEVRVPEGEPHSPACEVGGGARDLQENRCVAASGATAEAELRWSLHTREPVEGTVRRTFVALPASARPLVPGLQGHSWEGDAARFTLPGRARAELLLPPAMWAVLVDGHGGAVDLCGPTEKLQRCILGGGGGELVVAGAGERYLEANVTMLDAPERQVRLTGLFETLAVDDGRIRFEVPREATERIVEVEGAARCVLSLENGQRRSGCRNVLPAGRAAQLVVEHIEGPLRALTYAPGARIAALFPEGPAAAATATPLGEARAEQLSGVSMMRTFEVAKEAAVHLRASSGVCAISGISGGGGGGGASGPVLASGGFGRGCALDVVLRAGKYTARIRAFAQVPLAGIAAWTESKVTSVAEGVAEESWIAPGATRMFRFEVKAPGKVGLGLRVGAETLSCALFDPERRVMGEGCQQYVSLAPGVYLLRVSASPGAEPQRVRPVVFGLAGSRIDVPPEYLKDFFSRIGGEQ